MRDLAAAIQMVAAPTGAAVLRRLGQERFVFKSHRCTPVAVLPAPNEGRDTFRMNRTLMGNFSAGEVADLATGSGVRVLTPTYRDLFHGNRETQGGLFEYQA